MAKAAAIDRPWIAGECAKLIEIERALMMNAKARAESPPELTLGLLYHEIAASDERHIGAIERIAARYGHTPSPAGGGVGETLGWIRDKVAGLGSSAMENVIQDMAAKGDAACRLEAWAHVFRAIGDQESARELAGILAEERTHHKALQQGFSLMLEHQVCGQSGDVGAPAAAKAPGRVKKQIPK